MPVQRSVDKKREQLRRQLYGKEVMGPKPKGQSSSSSSHQTFKYSSSAAHTSSVEATTANYLVRDLTKILILSVVAVGLQILLFWAINHNLIKLPL